MSTVKLDNFTGFKRSQTLVPQRDSGNTAPVGRSKLASRPKESMSFAGKLIHSKSGWVLLEIPNAFVRGAFLALDVPGAQLPYHGDGRLNAHISVMRPADLEQIGGVAQITELGKRFKFQIGPLKEVEPLGWKAMDRVWLLTVDSPELETLRKSYGLPARPRAGDKTLNFHITVAVRKRGVLARSKTRKEAAINS